MKYFVLLFSGIADEPHGELDGKTPLEVAQTPNLDEITENGALGRWNVFSKENYPSAEFALSSLFMGDEGFFPGEGAIYASSNQIPVSDDSVVLACQLITSQDDKVIDPQAGKISEREVRALFEGLNRSLENRGVHFNMGKYGTHSVTIHQPEFKDELLKLRLPSTHALEDKSMNEAVPDGKAGQFIKEILKQTKDILESHDVNRVRIDLHENPANSIWLWGTGQSQSLPSFEDTYKSKAIMLSNSWFTSGLSKIYGISNESIDLGKEFEPNDLKQVAEKMLELSNSHDWIFLYLDYADMASSTNDYRRKVRWIEGYDEYIVGSLKNKISSLPHRMAITPLYTFSSNKRTLNALPVPVLWSGDAIHPTGEKAFSEVAASNVSNLIEKGQSVLKNAVKA